MHLDPTNLINTPAKFYDNAGFLRECFAKLGPHIKCCHAKDITLAGELTVHLAEAIPGRGRARLPRPAHARWTDWIPTRRSWSSICRRTRSTREATAHIRSVAEELGVAV